MRRTWRLAATAATFVLLFSACSSGATPSPAASGGPPASGGASDSPAGSAAGFDPTTVSGTVILSGWQASGEEGEALEKVLDGFRAAYPNITLDYQPIATDYPTAMAAKFSAKEPPDVFYVDSSVAQDWIDQGVLQELDTWAAERAFDTSAFFEGYLNAFKGPDGKTYGFPKDGNTLAMAYNTKMLSDAGVQPPTNWEELAAAAEKLTSGDQKAFCLNHSLDRALAFIYQNGGALLSDDKTQNLADSAEVRTALQTYLGWFAKGQAARAADLGDDWCGKSLGEGRVAMIFEGGWLDPFMQQSYPDTAYEWAEMPQGAQKATLGFTVSYSIGVDSANKDAAWVLLTYLTGPDGMKTWTEGGVANPSRTDVPAAAGKEILVDSAEFAKPWSFIPGFSKINDAFNNAMTAQIEAKSDDPEPVVSATKAALDEALSR
ncbi:MAG TPA: extracellular solute-binding protein [Candidatus Limnocylindrales bacterium]|nr:extracellular solute-binding protein [Candidatus Limnocylindrales bacterium]